MLKRRRRGMDIGLSYRDNDNVSCDNAVMLIILY